jgi:LAS superfamily LD-carboxypeptidase LdcB
MPELPCEVSFPPPPQQVSEPPSTEELLVPRAAQHWLGTVIHVADADDGSSPADFLDSATGAWLVEHAWEYGFIPALPESELASDWEPWKLRWVGTELAGHLQQRASPADLALIAREMQLAARPTSGG